MEAMITESQARRLVEWVIENGLSKEKAYEALAHTLNAKVPGEKKEEGPEKPSKQ